MPPVPPGPPFLIRESPYFLLFLQGRNAGPPLPRSAKFEFCEFHARNCPLLGLSLVRLPLSHLPPPSRPPFVDSRRLQAHISWRHIIYGLSLSSALFCSSPASRSPTICCSPYSATRSPLGFTSERAVSTSRTLYRPTIWSVASVAFFTRCTSFTPKTVYVHGVPLTCSIERISKSEIT